MGVFKRGANMSNRSFRCPLCGFCYGYFPDLPEASMHRRLMAAYGVVTWSEAEELARSKVPFRRTLESSWEGQECGDLSLTGVSCEGRLVEVTASNEEH